MGVMDFLFGTPDQTELDPQIKRARDFLLDQMLMQYSAGPVDVPQYMAMAPEARYSGSNALLSSLGLDTVAPPNMPTTTVGGMNVYTSQPFQEDMQNAFMNRYPAQYDYLRSFYMDPVTGEFGERSYGAANPIGAVTPRVNNSDGGFPTNSNNGSMSDEEIVMSQLGQGNFSLIDHLRADGFGTPISYDDPSSTGSYGGSLVTGKPSQSSSDFFDSVNQGSNYDGNAFSDIGNAISDTWGDFKDTVGSWFD
jgi:hypothetical protein